MAVSLDTRTENRDKIRHQMDKETNLKFRIVQIILGLVCVGSLAFSGVSIYRSYRGAQDADAQAANLESKLSSMKAEAQAWHEENDAERTEDDRPIVYKNLVSAKADGDELAALMNKFYYDGYLLKDAGMDENGEIINDQQRASELVTGDYTKDLADPTLQKFDPKKYPMTWEFMNYGDCPDPSFNCVMGCWYADPETSERYLMAVKFLTYNYDEEDDIGRFTVGATFHSEYMSMFLNEQNGTGPSPADEVSGMVNDLTGEGSPAGSGTDSGNGTKTEIENNSPDTSTESNGDTSTVENVTPDTSDDTNQGGAGGDLSPADTGDTGDTGEDSGTSSDVARETGSSPSL